MIRRRFSTSGLHYRSSNRHNAFRSRPAAIVIAILGWLGIYAADALAQPTIAWYRFDDPKTDLIGYKDGAGRVMVAPRFGGLTAAPIFKNIIPVTDELSKQSYYLVKDGRHVATDSLYIWDMTFDTEREGKIRFRDPRTDLTGFLDSTGKVVIPAVYNDAKPFNNDIALVIYNAIKVCWDGTSFEPRKPCEHWYWSGKTALVNSRGIMIADSLDIHAPDHINWYSMQTNGYPADTSLYISFRGTNGLYYSFIDYEKEFRDWFYRQYLPAMSDSLRLASINRLVCVEGCFKNRLRKFYSRDAFYHQYSDLLQKCRRSARSGGKKIEIVSEDLNQDIYTPPAFRQYFNDGNAPDAARFPAFTVAIPDNTEGGQNTGQQQLSFLRTAAGYKLIGMAFIK